MNHYFKSCGFLLTGLLSLILLVSSANAAQYNVASYFSLPNAATNDERAYQNDSGGLFYERSGGIMPARSTPAATNGPTVPASLFQESDGYNSLVTQGTAGLTDHGYLFNDPVYQQHGKTYNYDFVTLPASPTATTAADFLPANLKTPSPFLPAVVDTTVKTVFTRNFARVDEFVDPFRGKSVQPAYVHEVVTVDDNGGLLFDLTNPANPDYDPAFVAMWQVANGGSGIAHLKGLLKVTMQDTPTGVAGGPIWNGNDTTVFYLAAGVGTVCMIDSYGAGPGANVSIQQLISYKVGANSGAAAGVTSQLVKVQNPAGAALATSSVSLNGPQVWDPLAINPATGQPTGAMVQSYTSDVFMEQTAGSGIFKLYYMQGDLVDLTLRGAGYADQAATAQNLTTLATTSAPNPVPYTLNTLLGTISGKMLDAAGNPVANVKVLLSKQTTGGGFGPNGWIPPVVVRTDVNGNYSAQVDPAFNYGISVGIQELGLASTLPVGSLGGLVTQTGLITLNPSVQPPGSFTAASAATVIVNIQLAAGAVIRGQLTDANGALYANANIQLQLNPAGGFGGGLSAVTDANGTYVITVPAASYSLQVAPNWNNATGNQGSFPAGMMGGYVSATGVLTPQMNASTNIYALTTATPTFVNMQLVKGAVVSGTLTDANGTAVANAQIRVNDSVAGLFGFTTDAAGKYSVTVAPGTAYTIMVLPGWNPATGQQAQFPNGMTGGFVGATGALVPNVAQAKQFNLQLATPIVVNMQLIPGATVAGVLRDVNGALYANAQIILNNTAGGPGGFQMTNSYSTTTAANGSYSITVAPGSYTIAVTEGWDTTTNQPVPFPAGMLGGMVTGTGVLISTGSGNTYTLNAGTTTVVNMQLAAGAVVSGLLIDVGGAPYANAQIFFRDSIANQFGSAMTDATGHYSVTVAPGNYTVNVRPGFDFATNKPGAFPSGMMGGYVSATGGLIPNIGNAKQYTFTTGSNNVVNLQLAAGAIVRGQVRGLAGAPYAFAQVSLYSPSTSASGGAMTDARGNYSVTVNPGTYFIQVGQGVNLATGQLVFFPAGMLGGYANTVGPLTGQPGSTSNFTLTAATPTIVNMQLVAPTLITGTLTDTTGAPYANATIMISDPATGSGAQVSTDATGNYSVSVAAGSYIIHIIPGFNPVTGQQIPFPAGMTGGYVGTTGALVQQQSAAKSYVVTVGATTVVNMQLAAGAVISGTLTDTAGVPYANANVTVYNNGVGSGLVTDVTGTYSITVAAGTYNIQVSPGWDTATGQPAPFPAGMTGGYAGATGALVQQYSAAKNYVVTAGVTTVVNMQLSAVVSAGASTLSFLGTDAAGPIMSVVDATGAVASTPVGFFNASVTTLAGVPIDVNGDGVKEYAVVAQRADGLIMCQVRRADGTLVKAFFITASAQASVLSVYAAQMDAVAGEELVIGKVRSIDNRPVVAIHNPNTGAKLMETFMLNGNWTASNFFPVDVNGDGIKEIALGAVKANGLVPSFIPINRPGVQIRNADGSMFGYAFPMAKDFTGVKFARMDRNGDGTDEIVALGMNANSRWMVQVLNATTAAQLSLNVILSTPYNPVSLLAGNVDGVVGDEVILGSTLKSNGRAVFDIRNGTSNARIKLLFMQAAVNVPDQFALADWDGNGVQDVMVRATSGATPNYLVKRPDNTVVFTGMPAGISGVGDRFTGNM